MTHCLWSRSYIALTQTHKVNTEAGPALQSSPCAGSLQRSHLPCEHSSQAAKRSWSTAAPKPLGQGRGFQATTLCLPSLGRYQAQGDQFLVPDTVVRVTICTSGFPTSCTHFFCLSSLWPHRPQRPHSAWKGQILPSHHTVKKGSQRRIGISFQLLTHLPRSLCRQNSDTKVVLRLRGEHACISPQTMVFCLCKCWQDTA